MGSAVAHLDADCFYVSAERVRRPELDGLPVGVLGNQGACVIAKSYELKAKGVATGEPIWDARRKWPAITPTCWPGASPEPAPSRHGGCRSRNVRPCRGF